MRYKLVAFDLDGTLLDTLDDLTFAANASLQKHGMPARTREEVRAFVGDGIQMLMKRCASPNPYFDGLLQAFKETYAEHCQDKTAPYEGIMSLLATLKETGMKTAVLSIKADFATKRLVKAYFGEYIPLAVGENEAAGVRKKPAPDALFAVMKEMGVEREETLYVGDSEVDILTAHAAGVDCVSVTWGFKDRDFLVKNGATTLIDMPSQLLECLDEKV